MKKKKNKEAWPGPKLQKYMEFRNDIESLFYGPVEDFIVFYILWSSMLLLICGLIAVAVFL